MHNQFLAIDDADLDLSTVRKVGARAAFADIVQRTHETGDQLNMLAPAPGTSSIVDEQCGANLGGCDSRIVGRTSAALHPLDH